MRTIEEQSVKFAHRFNKDGTIDSICPHCFSTVCTSNVESDLGIIESVHVCDPARLAYYEESAVTIRKDLHGITYVWR